MWMPCGSTNGSNGMTHEWVELDKQKPAHLQKVIYLSPYVGAWRGQYDDLSFTFFSKGGFLDGYDVTYWMPDEGQDMPKKPEGFKSAWDQRD